VLGVASRGEALVLGVLLVALELRPATVVAVGGALLASSWRWGTTSLEALAGAQAVLGPAGGVGPAAAATGSWLAAAALVLALGRRPDPLRIVPAGVVAAAVLAGPAPGGDLPVRVFVALGAAAAALGLAQLRAGRRRVDRALELLAALVGLGAVAAVAPDAPSWPPSIELADVGEGLALAASAAAALLAGVLAWRRARWSGRGSTPNVAQPGPRRAHLLRRPR
jgi:hypothetical protein